ncbi:DUF3558 domain-containing protein [Actinosynnema sp. NPDC050436]|uniref:DUF3558 domain-containing protein n=1 Tax=Actinosynnema sp. NPDC050436 TaxID=3155659 RepID=UPI003403D6B3
MNPRLRLACLVVPLLALGACSEPTHGFARGASTTSAKPTRPSTGPTGTTTPGNADTSTTLERTDPCSYLTRQEAEGALGRLLKDPENRKVASAVTCRYSPSYGVVVVAVRTNVGIAGVQPNGGEIKEASVSGRPAKELLDSTGSCGIYMGVTETSRVDVVVTTVGSDKPPCPIAVQVAGLVEPRLP